jgi:hypothetical protein
LWIFYLTHIAAIRRQFPWGGARLIFNTYPNIGTVCFSFAWGGAGRKRPVLLKSLSKGCNMG